MNGFLIEIILGIFFPFFFPGDGDKITLANFQAEANTDEFCIFPIGGSGFSIDGYNARILDLLYQLGPIILSLDRRILFFSRFEVIWG